MFIYDCLKLEEKVALGWCALLESLDRVLSENWLKKQLEGYWTARAHKLVSY
jgi:hypothetical protein